RGYVETPTQGKDVLFAWARNTPQKWYVAAIASNLCFFEYSERQLMGVNSSVWRELIFDNWQHPLQDVFLDNQDVFNVMFQWTDRFPLFVFYQDGSIKTLNTSTDFPDQPLGVPHSFKADSTTTLQPIRFRLPYIGNCSRRSQCTCS